MNDNELKVLKRGLIEAPRLKEDLSQALIKLRIAESALQEIAQSPPNGELAIRTAKKALGLKIYA